jgi:hypothetical protein
MVASTTSGEIEAADWVSPCSFTARSGVLDAPEAGSDDTERNRARSTMVLARR